MSDDRAANQARILDTLDTVYRYWLRHPELRLGEIVSRAAGSTGAESYYITDDALRRALTKEDQA